MDEKKYHKLLAVFCENGDVAQWCDELGRGSMVDALRTVPEDAFKIIVKDLPSLMQAAVEHGQPPYGDIPGSRKIYSVINPDPGYKDDQPHGNYREHVNRSVNKLFDEYMNFKECDPADLSSMDESRFERMKLASERLQALFKAFGGKHSLGSMDAFGDEVEDKGLLGEMTKFFAGKSLSDALPKPDTSGQNALREEMEAYGASALGYWQEHESTFEAFSDALNKAPGNMLTLDLVEAFFNPLLEKFHVFDQGHMQDIKELLRRGRDAYGSITGSDGLTSQFDKVGVGFQEQKDALYFLEQKETEFDEFRDAIASKVNHAVGMNLDIAAEQANDDVERRVEIYQLNEKLAAVGLSFAPGNKTLAAHAATIGKRIADDIEAHQKAVEKAVWPGHMDGFAGPGDVDDLAAVALKDVQRILKTESQKLGQHYFAAAVAGNWYVSRFNILRQATQIRIPVWIAHTLPDQPGIAKVFKAYMVSKYVKEEPPFSRFTSSEEFRMPVDKIVKAASVIDQKALKAGTK